ncbi:MAG: hypothetical protein LBB74_09180 [Chitinispirillales bacterium]|jgi:hypothetical protein|nr:hypothetical protein [Chitinispirillales bacterium]
MKKTLVTALIFFAALRAGAQSPLGINYPLGVPDLAVTGASAAMGGGGTAAVDEYMGASLNPANAAVGNRAIFSALISYDIVNVYDDGASAEVSGYMPKLLSIILPAGRAGNVVFAMQKRYDANLNFHATRDYTLEPTMPTTHTPTIEIHRKGGLSSWQAGWAYRFGNGVSLGLIYERLFFSLDSRYVRKSVLSYYLDKSDVESYTTTVTDSANSDFSSDAFRFGTQIPVHGKVTLGFTGEYMLPGRDNGSETGGHRRSDDTSALGYHSKKFSATLPWSMGIGAAYRPSDHWLFVADARTTPWDFYEKFYEDEPDDTAAKPQWELGVSAGARYIPAANRLSSKYWEKINYGAGARYATLPNGKDYGRAREYAFSVGAGLPIPRDGGMVDIVVSFGKRYDPKYSKYEESVVKLQLGLNGGRNWFQKDASKEY